MAILKQNMSHWKAHKEELNRLPVSHVKWES